MFHPPAHKDTVHPAGQITVDSEPAKKLDQFTAVGLAEGFIEGSEEEQIEAWQYLVDTGLAWQLQGWFGRQAEQLIARGILHAKKQ